MNSRSPSWWVLLVVVYQDDFDSPWTQFIGGNLSEERAEELAQATDAIAAVEAKMPVHMRRGGQSARYVLRLVANSGIQAIQRAILMLQEARLQQRLDDYRLSEGWAALPPADKEM